MGVIVISIDCRSYPGLIHLLDDAYMGLRTSLLGAETNRQSTQL